MKRGIITNATDWRSRKLQGKTVFQGLPISIENDRGSYRQGMDPNGESWRTPFLNLKYGYIRGTMGSDGDHVDVYIGPHGQSSRVFVVNQKNPDTGKFDEWKVMLGFESYKQAKLAYLGQYDRPDYFGDMVEVDMATFKDLLKQGKGKEPLKKSINLVPILEKAKYIKRWRGKGGKWNYLYREPKGPRLPSEAMEQGTLPGMSEKEITKLLKNYRRRAPGKGREATIQKQTHLDTLLRRSTFCMMSAGRNPEDPKDMKLTDKQIADRYTDLLSDLKAEGYVYTRCRGKYVNPEESVMVMCHDAEKSDMMKLGKKYKQDSIVFSNKGRGSLIYTTGEKAGKEEMAGEGYEVVPKATDFYTKMPLANGDTVKFTINLEELVKALRNILYAASQRQDSVNSLWKGKSGQWYLSTENGTMKFYWLNDLSKAVNGNNQVKKYYSSDEIKARGMRWVTIRGARVLLQSAADGGYVVVGGAGGKLNHLKIDQILSKEEYAKRRKDAVKKKKEEAKPITQEEIAEAEQKKVARQTARTEARKAYTQAITGILGTTPEGIRESITDSQMKDLEKKSREMVEARKSTKNMSPEAVDRAVEKQTEKEVKKSVERSIRNVERDALKALMADYMPVDPNAKESFKELLDKDKAAEILAARKKFRKELKAIGKTTADVPTDLKVSSVFAAATESDLEEIQKEVRNQIETAKNIEMYDALNAQSLSINKHVDDGAVSALNGMIGDVYGSGAVFNADTIKELGIDAVARIVTAKIQMDGKGDTVKKALEEYTSKEREKVVDRALAETKKRLKNADSLRDLARDKDDSEAILTMASANGHALKQITAAQRALGTAVGSLRSAAHMINALEDPLPNVIQVDMGKDLAIARDRASAAGLTEGTYSMKAVQRGRGKRFVMEIPKESINSFFQGAIAMSEKKSMIDEIKSHKLNDGYVPSGIKENIKLDASQEAGLRFFNEKGRVLLDFEAGLGKTATAYAAMMDAMANRGAKKILVVTPSATRGDFYSQRETFLDPDKQKKVHMSAANTSKAERRRRHLEQDGIHIVSQDSLREDKSILKDAGYDMVVIDEIHEMTAGTGRSARYMALKQLEDVPNKIAMSGTNIKSSKRELYRKIDFVDPEHTLGSMSDFEKRYKGLNQGTGIFQDAANDAFRKEISDWVYTQKNRLPVENSIETLRVPMTPVQRKAYAESERVYRDEQVRKLPGASARRDSRNYAILADGATDSNAKIDTIISTMNSNHPEEKAVVHVSQPGRPVIKAMRTAQSRLEAEYGKGSVGMIHGGTSPSELKKLKAAFNDPGNPLRFIVGTKSLESGHNLQAGGSVTFHLDIPDSAAAFDQRNARVFRKGQNIDTSTYVLSGLNPLDMRSEDLMATKRKEMSILGNPRSVSSNDDTGFLGMLNKYEEDITNVKAS